MPKQTKQGTRSRSSAAAKKPASAPEPGRPALYLESIATPRPPRGDYILRDVFHRMWRKEWREWILGDAQRIRAHSHANYDERRQQQLAVLALNVTDFIERATVLAEVIEDFLVRIEGRMRIAQDAVEEEEAEEKKGRSRKGSKRTE